MRFSSRALCSSWSLQTTSITRSFTSARAARSRHWSRAGSTALTASTMTDSPGEQYLLGDRLGDEVGGETGRLVGVDSRAEDRGFDRIDRDDRGSETRADDLGDGGLSRTGQTGHGDEHWYTHIPELPVDSRPRFDHRA